MCSPDKKNRTRDPDSVAGHPVHPVWSKKSNGLERRGLQPRLVSSDCLLPRLDSGGISAIVSGGSPRRRLRDNLRGGGLSDRLLLRITYDMVISRHISR